ncbi:MAG TPA: polymer-forming cytoskeletal protein [Vicinamibacterales bacterium]|nr:polymer-forming cytoskeletal protein [Vicinamibacterales bacterium]
MHAHSRSEEPSCLPSGLTVSGDLASDHDLAIDGTFDGQITLPEQHLTISSSARVKAKIVARAVTIAGRLDGTVTATERVSIETRASVNAHLQTPSLVLADGAQFTGSVDPSRTEAAMLVARYRQKQG